MNSVDPKENRRRMEAGELYFAFTPDLLADRKRCTVATQRFNNAGADISRRCLVEMWKDIINDTSPLPSEAPSPEEDDALLSTWPWIDGPITKLDYGYNVKLGEGVYVNSGSTWIDTCTIEIGARTLIGPNCSFYSGTHPLDPFLRNGTNGPEAGKPIKIGEDCWFGGNCIVLPGVTIGRGVTVGAGSVVTKDVPDFVVVVGNPARVLKKIETALDGEGRYD
ncbi:galactoside O-acetyltransferase [Coniochaeta ligniaria NRRL 30616]|uniref:Galactoside O-acetyltransferase n=1 Tax=Coniochaeta ligniaria NRRL 30616 TaxID=1408157 RepID=A0A1J7J0I9_9PEZI|nr:galactoside O-acetyltransferase [Coniochaeta ligniaria NRRL 30616]